MVSIYGLMPEKRQTHFDARVGYLDLDWSFSANRPLDFVLRIIPVPLLVDVARQPLVSCRFRWIPTGRKRRFLLPWQVEFLWHPTLSASLHLYLRQVSRSWFHLRLPKRQFFWLSGLTRVRKIAPRSFPCAPISP